MLALSYSEPLLAMQTKMRQLIELAFDSRISLQERRTFQKELYGIKEEITNTRDLSIKSLENQKEANQLINISKKEMTKEPDLTMIAQANQDKTRVAELLF